MVLTDYDIQAELTTAPRAGIIRFTFHENKQSRSRLACLDVLGILSKCHVIKVDGGTDANKVKFYTSIYRTMVSQQHQENKNP